MHWRQQASAAPPSSVNSYLNKPAAKQFHLATQVEVNISGQTKTLQDAINAGEVLYTKNKNVQCYDPQGGSSDTAKNLYYYDSCNGVGNLQTDCSLGVNTVPSYTGLLCSTYIDPTKPYSIYKTGIQNQPFCSNSACSSRSASVNAKLVECSLGYTCTDGDTSGDCFTGWNPTGVRTNFGCNTFASFLPSDNCNEDNINPSSCPAGFTGTCIDIDYQSCKANFRSYTEVFWNIRTLQCNSL